MGSYWRRRYLQISIDRDRRDQEYIRQIHRQYDDLSNSLYKEIQHWVDRYADNDVISAESAYEVLSKSDQKTWSMTLDQYRQRAIDGGYDQQLNREYFKSRISRLEQLERQLYFELAEMANDQEDAMKGYLKESLNESYLRQMYELTDRGAFSLEFSRYSSHALRVAISKPWKGNNFSGRIWKNHLKTIPDRLSKTMTLSILHGWGIDRTVKEMMFGIDSVLRNRMTTLVQTESAHLAELANDKSMAETGVKKWEWLATIEIHTCQRCGDLDGQEYEVADENAPNCPDHPNCRCTRVPVIAGWISASRWQRDPETGNGSVKDHQTFDEWKHQIEKEQEKKLSANEFGANLDYIRSSSFFGKLLDHEITSHIADDIAHVSRRMTQHRNGTPFEDYYLLDYDTGKVIAVSNQARKKKGVVYNSQVKRAFETGNKEQYISIHNHPSGYPPSLADFGSLSLESKRNSVKLGLTIGHDGSVYWYTAPKVKIPHTAAKLYDQLIEKHVKMGYTEIKAQEVALEMLSMRYHFEFGRID